MQQEGSIQGEKIQQVTLAATPLDPVEEQWTPW